MVNERKVGPNPFTDYTKITYTLSKSLDDAKLSIYDTKGRVIKNLQQGRSQAGQHEVIWDGTNDSGQTVAAGSYFYVLQIGNATFADRLVKLQ